MGVVYIRYTYRHKTGGRMRREKNVLKTSGEVAAFRGMESTNAITIREHIVIEAFNALLSSSSSCREEPSLCARLSIRQADALLLALSE